jgi:hypothetical protein
MDDAPQGPKDRPERDTPVTYSREESERIRAIIASDTEPLVCPRCNGTLELGVPLAAGGTIHPVWEIRCLTCHRTTFATRVASSRRGRGS